MSARSYLLTLAGLRAGYGEGDRAAIAVEALTVRTGEWVAVLGQNGSGKSTLLRALAGQLAYEGSAGVTAAHETKEPGTAASSGRELRALAPRKRARLISYLPQQLAVPDMDVETLVAHGRFPYHGFSGTLGAEDRERIRDAMEKTDVSALRERPLRALSGGERQRAYLAMVIAQDAPFLLLDEPCASLDIAHQKRILKILRDLAGSGKGVLMTSHDIPQSLSVGDRVCLLHGGCLRFVGTPGELAAEENRALLAETLGIGVRRVADGADAAGERILYPYVLTG